MIVQFRYGVISRVLLLAANIFLVIYLFTNTSFYVSTALIGILIIGQVVNLIMYVEETNNQLKRFFEAIKYNDFSQSFTGKNRNRSFAALNEILNQVIEKFKSERAKGEESFRYLQTVVQHIGIGLVSFNQNGNIELINTAAKRIFDVSYLRKIGQLKEVSEPLYKGIIELKSGEKTLVNCSIGSESMQLAIYATEFRMKGSNYKLISIQNISSELDDKEMQAWQNLTQVLAHEIMNSITPIASLSDTISSMLIDDVFNGETNSDLSQENLQDVKEALTTINKRSLGLMRFVNSYRNITQIPDPIFEVISVNELLLRVKNLMRGEAANREVSIRIEVDPESLEITADTELIEQALINIVKNAFKVLKGVPDPVISLRGGMDDSGRAVIDVEDNGPGIKQAVLDKIFVPFYTTSKATGEDGSGIGLSLSRQIMRMHRGTLSVKESNPGRTIFTLRF